MSRFLENNFCTYCLQRNSSKLFRYSVINQFVFVFSRFEPETTTSLKTSPTIHWPQFTSYHIVQDISSRNKED